MGVDYYNCSTCGEIANDCGEHCFCDDCMNFFCGYCDEGKRLCRIELLTKDECPVCLKTKIPDDVVFDEALKQLGKTKEQIAEELKAEPSDASLDAERSEHEEG